MTRSPASDPRTAALQAEIAAAAADPRRRIGRYLLLGELGRGAMGLVYRAWDPGLSRLVAIKTLPAFGGDRQGERLARFQREARATASLRHPGLVTVFEVGVHAGLPFIAFELIDGEPLDAIIEREAAPRREVLRVVRDVALALHHAHEHGVVHRDVKPGNVMVERGGRAILMDFGLARSAGEESLSATGQAIGTPHYMSPEQADGDPRAIGPSSDVYALGATIYRVIAGRTPFVAEGSGALFKKILLDDPEPPSTARMKAPHALDGLVLACLEKDPANRPASAAEVAHVLTRYLEGKPLAPRERASKGQPAAGAGSSSRVPLLAGAAAIAAVGLLALIVALVLGSGATGSEARSGPGAVGDPTSTRASPAGAPPRGAVEPELTGPGPSGTVEEPPPAPAPAPDWASIEYLWLGNIGPRIRRVAFSPDGELLVIVGEFWDVILLRAESGEEVQRLTIPAPSGGSGPVVGVNDLVFGSGAEDGRHRLYLACGDGWLRTTDVGPEGASPLVTLGDRLEKPMVAVAVSPAEWPRIAVSSRGLGVYVLEPRGQRAFELACRWTNDLAFVPDSDRSWLAVAGTDYMVHVFDVGGEWAREVVGSVRLPMKPVAAATAQATTLAWRTGGAELAIGRWGRGMVEVYSLDGRLTSLKSLSVPGGDGIIAYTSAAPDGSCFAAAGGNYVMVWGAADHRLLVQAEVGMFEPGSGKMLVDVAWGPKSRILVAASSEGDVWVFSLIE